MFSTEVNIEFGDQPFVLLPQKCLWQPQAKHLFIADCHFGKVNHFRKNGIAIPRAAAEQDLLVLHTILSQLKPQVVFFMGDLFHSNHNAEWTQLQQLLSLHACTYVLVQGNHDILPHQAYAEMFTLVPSYMYGKITLSHEPLSTQTLHICGHIHPGFRVQTGAKTSQTLPCFFMQGKQLILPAFGGFTGNVAQKKSPNSRAWALLNQRLFEV